MLSLSLLTIVVFFDLVGVEEVGVEVVIEMSGLGFAALGQQDYHIYGWEDVGRIKAIMRSDDPDDMEEVVFTIRPSKGQRGGKFALQTPYGAHVAP